MAGERILIVDDEPAIQATLRGVLEDEGFRVSAVGRGTDALRFFADDLPDLTFLDIWMDQPDGLETLAEIKRTRPEAIVVMISGQWHDRDRGEGDAHSAPTTSSRSRLSLEKVLLTVSRALEHARLERENSALRASLDQRNRGRRRQRRVPRASASRSRPRATNGRVLIHGENGSGKELVARSDPTPSPPVTPSPSYEVKLRAISRGADRVRAVVTRRAAFTALADWCVDRARDQFLAAAVLAVDSSGRCGRGGRDLLAEHAEHGAVADDLGALVEAGAERRVLALEPRVLEARLTVSSTFSRDSGFSMKS